MTHITSSYTQLEKPSHAATLNHTDSGSHNLDIYCKEGESKKQIFAGTWGSLLLHILTDSKMMRNPRSTFLTMFPSEFVSWGELRMTTMRHKAETDFNCWRAWRKSCSKMDNVQQAEFCLGEQREKIFSSMNVSIDLRWF